MLWDPPLVIYVYQEHLDENCIKKGIKIENEKNKQTKNRKTIRGPKGETDTLVISKMWFSRG